MIKQHRQFSLLDMSGEDKDVDVEVNWNSSPLVSGNELIRLTIGDQEAMVKRDHLWQIVFMLSTEQQQEKMIPVRMSPLSVYNTVVEIEAGRDTRKGERFHVPLTVTVDKDNGQMRIKS